MLETRASVTRRPEEEEVYFNYGKDSVGKWVKERLGLGGEVLEKREEEVETGAFGEPCLS